MQVKQKTFRDFFGKEIKVGDRVLHLWATVARNGYVFGGESAIKHKQAKVISLSKGGVRIEWRETPSEPARQSTVFNTVNRIIVLKNGLVEIDEDGLINEACKTHEVYKKKARTRIANLKKESEKKEEHIKHLLNEMSLQDNRIFELEEEIKELKSLTYRFELMDFDD